MRNYSALLVMLALASPASADFSRVSVLTHYSHFSGDSFPRDGAALGLFLTDEPLTVGCYQGSFRKIACTAQVGLEMVSWRGGEAGVLAGLSWYPGHGDKFPVRVGDIVLTTGVYARHGSVWGQCGPLDSGLVCAVGLTWSTRD